MTFMASKKWRKFFLQLFLVSLLPISVRAADLPEIKIRMGHADRILAIAASPDGKELATCSNDAINLWDAAAGTVKRTLAREKELRYHTLCGDLAYTPDGRFLLTSGVDNILWDLSSGQQVFSAVRDPGFWADMGSSPVAMAKDGKKFLYVAGRTRVVFADLMTNKEIATFEHSDKVNAVALSPNGLYAATGGDDKVVRLWEISSGKEIRTFGGLFSGHSKAVTSIAFSPDGSRIVSGSRDETVRIWDVETGKELYKEKEVRWMANEVGRVVISPNGQLLAIMSELGFSVKNIGAGMQSVRDEDSLSNAVCFSPDSRYLFYGKGNRPAIKEVAPETGREIRQPKESNYALALAYSPNGRYIAVSDESVRLYDVASEKLQWEKPYGCVFPGCPRVHAIAFSRDSTLVATADSDGEIVIHRVADGKPVTKFKAGTKSLTALAFSPDGGYLGSVSDDGTVKFWQLETGREMSSLKVESDVFSLSFSADSREASILTRSGEVKVVEAASGAQLSASSISHGKIFHALLSHDNRKVLSCSDYGIALFSLPDGKVVQQFKTDPIRSLSDLRLAFSDDDQQVLGYSNGTFVIWDAKTGNILAEREAGKRALTYSHFAWAPDGEHVMVNLDGGSLCELRLQGHDNIPTFVSNLNFDSVGFAADGKGIVLGNRIFDGSGLSINVALGPSDILTPRGEYAVAASLGNIYVKELASLKTVWRDSYNPFLTPSISAEDVKVPWNESVVAVPDDKGFHLLDFKTGAMLREVEVKSGPARLWQISPDGKYLLLEAGGSQLWDLDSAKRVRQEKSIPGQLVPWKGTTVLATVEGGAVILSDLETGREISRFPAPKGELFSSSDGALAIVELASGRLSLTDVATGSPLKNFKGISDKRSSFSLDGRFLLSKERDGTAILWDIASGGELVHFYAFSDGEWIAVTPQGYFNASPNAAKYLSVEYDGRSYAIDQFFETLFNPAAVASAVRGVPFAGAGAADIRKGFKPPPTLAFESPTPGLETHQQQIAVVLKANDNGGGIDEVRVFVNGKVLEEGSRGVSIVPKGDRRFQRSFLVPLVEGDNHIKAIAFSKERIEGDAVEMVVRYTPLEVRRPDLYLFTVGINSYRNGALNLRYAIPDAREISDYFEHAPAVKNLFNHVTVLRLLNEKATRAGILAGLEQLRQMTRPEDLVVLFFSGHGETSGKSWYFIPYELATPEDEGELKRTGISGEELAEAIRGLKSQKIFGILDSCKSGAQLIAMRGLEERTALVQLGRSTGIYMLSASTDAQLAAEVKDLGHGLLTYSVLEGLKGRAGGRKVTVEGLLKYVKERLPELTTKYQGSAQYPVSWGRGMDFPLVLNGE